MTLQEAIDRLKSMCVIAGTAGKKSHRVYAFSPRDAEAIRIVLARLKETGDA